MLINEELITKLTALKEKMAARGQEVSLDELIRAHQRGISGEKAELLDGLLQEAKDRLQSEVNAGKESFLLDPDE